MVARRIGPVVVGLAFVGGLHAALAQDCSTPSQCDDGNVCTRDRCESSSCTADAAVYGDATGDLLVDLADVLCVLDGFSGQFATCSPAAVDLMPCSGDGLVDLTDILAVVDAFAGIDACCGCSASDEGLACDDGDPCTVGDTCAERRCLGTPQPACGITGGLTAYRPLQGSGYTPLPRTAVPDALELDDDRGPGIRINGPDADPQGEDDLIELVVTVDPVGAAVVLHRGAPAIALWTTRTREPGTQLSFVDDRTAPLPFAAGQSTLTVWIEWLPPAHGTADLTLEPAGAAVPLDAVRLRTFRHIVMALGGEGQVPGVPVDANHGTFVAGLQLYADGFDVHLHDEDDVSATGTGVVYNEVVTAIQHRGVDEVAILGYSHGGGSTYDLADRLDLNRAGIGVFEIVATSYADGVGNDSDIDVFQETRRPPASGFHANHYQVGSLSDFFLDGGAVPSSQPPPSGLNVETTPWGAGSTHFDVDDYIQVRSFITDQFKSRVTP